ncbi:MAG: phytoene desaturase family protein [Anaerolineae bacterium]
MGALGRYVKMSVADFATRCRNPLLRGAIESFFVPEMPFIFFVVTMANLANKDSGYPIGGSLPMAQAAEQRYLGLGGEISYRSRVDKILVQNDRAVGVRLEDGSEHRADYVISAADGHATIFDMLEGKYVDDTIRGYYEKLPRFPAIINIGLGLNHPCDDMPRTVTGTSFPLAQPTTIAGQERQRLSVHFYNFDPTLAPPGKTVANVILDSDYAYWAKLRQEDRERYRAEKEQVADQVVAALEGRYPGLAAAVEMRDVATPATYVRYTGNWQGSFEGWLPTVQTTNLQMRKTLPGLDNFYMVGQWVAPGGGLPPAGFRGRHVTQILCRRDGKPFVAREP